MGHAYTPGLTVTERTVIRKPRLLPIRGTVLAKAGDRVRAESVVARAALPGKVHVVNVANLHGVAADAVRDYLVKKERATASQDDVIAANRQLVHWYKRD